MAETEELRIVLRTIAELAGAAATRDALRGVRTEVQQTGGAVGISTGQLLRMGAAFAGVNTGLAAVHQGLVAVAGAFSDVVATGAEFAGEMAGVAAVSGASARQLALLSEAARTGGLSIGVGAREGAKGLQELIKGGVSAEAALGGALRSTQLLAKAGGVDLATAAEISATAMNSFGLSAADLARVADLVAGAANASSIGVDDMRLSLSQAGAVARTIGVSFDDTAVAIAELGKAGIKGSDAGTSLRTFLLSLSGTSAQATDELRKLGIVTADGSNKFFDATGKAKGLAEVSQILKTATAGYTDQQKLATLQVIFGTDALRAASVFAREGAEGFDTLAAAMAKVGAKGVAEQRLDSLAGDLEKLKAQAEATSVAVEKAIDPQARRAAQLGTLAVQGVEEGRFNFLAELGKQVGELVIPVGVRMVFDTSEGNIIDQALRTRQRFQNSLNSGGVPLNAESDLREVVNTQILKEQQAAQAALNPLASKFLETWRTIDATLINAQDSFTNISRDLTEMQSKSNSLGSIISALDISDTGARAELAVIQDIALVRERIRAQDAVAVAARNAALDKEATKITDPRDAAGNQALREAVRLREQLLPLEQALAEARRNQSEISAQVAAAQGAEALAILQILPQRQEIARLEWEQANAVDRRVALRQTEIRLLAQQAALQPNNALEDTRAKIQRDELVLGIRGQDAATKQAARREIRDLERNVLPRQELAAFDANRGVAVAERSERAGSIADQLRQTPAQMQIEALRNSAVAGERMVFALSQTNEHLGLLNQVASALTAAADRQIKVFVSGQVDSKGLTGASPADAAEIANQTAMQIYRDLTEGISQASAPPVIPQSGVRR